MGSEPRQASAFRAGSRLERPAYVSDTENSTIRKIDVASGAVTTIAGSAWGSGRWTTGNRGTLRGARRHRPRRRRQSLHRRHRQQRHPRAELEHRYGLYARGQRGPSRPPRWGGRRCFLLQAESPANGCTGNLYVADAFNSALRKVVPATGVVTTIAIFAAVPRGSLRRRRRSRVLGLPGRERR